MSDLEAPTIAQQRSSGSAQVEDAVDPDTITSRSAKKPKRRVREGNSRTPSPPPALHTEPLPSTERWETPAPQLVPSVESGSPGCAAATGDAAGNREGCSADGSGGPSGCAAAVTSAVESLPSDNRYNHRNNNPTVSLSEAAGPAAVPATNPAGQIALLAADTTAADPGLVSSGDGGPVIGGGDSFPAQEDRPAPAAVASADGSVGEAPAAVAPKPAATAAVSAVEPAAGLFLQLPYNADDGDLLAACSDAMERYGVVPSLAARLEGNAQADGSAGERLAGLLAEGQLLMEELMAGVAADAGPYDALDAMHSDEDASDSEAMAGDQDEAQEKAEAAEGGGPAGGSAPVPAQTREDLLSHLDRVGASLVNRRCTVPAADPLAAVYGSVSRDALQL